MAKLWVVVRNGEILVHEADGVPALPTLDPLEVWRDAAQPLIELGRSFDCDCFALSVDAGAEPPTGMRFATARSLFGALDEPTLHVVGKAIALTEFEATHRFCGSCGTPTKPSALERARVCPSCGATAYPRIPPAVITLIERGDQLLLARSARFKAGMYSAIAGFVEVGESLEQAAAREVKEEVGVEIEDLRYFGSQPWPFGKSLMVGFFARYRAGEITVDGEEIAEAAWFDSGALPLLPPPISIARKLIEAYLQRRRDAS
jgi:NAD+ diphosphatase